MKLYPFSCLYMHDLCVHLVYILCLCREAGLDIPLHDMLDVQLKSCRNEKVPTNSQSSRHALPMMT